MKRIGPSSHWTGCAVGLAIGVVLTGWLVGRPAERPLYADSFGGGTTRTIVEPTADGAHVVYIFDEARHSLCVYQFDPRKGRLRLAATRQLSADQQLLEFNNEEPRVSDIEKLSRQR